MISILDNYLLYLKVLKASVAQSLNLDQDLKSISIQTLTLRDNLAGAFDDLIKKGFRFVVVIIVEDPLCYPKVKQASELRSAGILTQCKLKIYW